jgi:hypothetical protein
MVFGYVLEHSVYALHSGRKSEEGDAAWLDTQQAMSRNYEGVLGSTVPLAATMLTGILRH